MHKIIRMRNSVILLVLALVICFSTVPVFAATPQVGSVSIYNIWIPQNKDAVSYSKWNYHSGTTYYPNTCFDYQSSFRPYSNWPSIDYTNSTGKASGEDRVLRRAEIRIYVLDSSTGRPYSGGTVTLSCSLGTNCYVKNPDYTTDSTGYTTGYVEFYGQPTFTVTAYCSGTSGTSSSYTVSNASYYNKFLLTEYNFALRSRSGSDAQFKADVLMEGSGYNDLTSGTIYQANTWYVASGSNIVPGTPTTASGTPPTEGRSIAVDSPYITRRSYNGGSGTAWHRGKVYINGLSNSSGDSGYRTSEDSGAAINGYHIDIFIGTKTPSQFTSTHPNLSIENGEYCGWVTYISTLLGGTLQ